MLSKIGSKGSKVVLGLGGAAAAGVVGFGAYSWSFCGCTPAVGAARVDHHRVVIIGGGSAGMSVASQLCRKLGASADIAIVEPADTHYYQAGWTMVGGGLCDLSLTSRPMGSVLPSRATWIKAQCTGFDPEENAVVLGDGSKLKYDYLVAAAGIDVKFDAIKGLPETLGKNGVGSIYDWRWAPSVWESIQNHSSGVAIFTDPTTPIKCGGAPQKIMFLAEDAWRKSGAREKTEISFVTGKGVIFAVKPVGDALQQLHTEKNITNQCGANLVEVDGPNHVATFALADGSKVEKKFDFLHVVPPMTAPKFICDSKIANQAGFVDVDKSTCQHTKYPNIFSLGDCSALPSSKTYAAISAQAPVLVHNLQEVMSGRPANAKYEGYACCPILTGDNKAMMAEFKYGGVMCGTFEPFIKPTEQSAIMYFMKRHAFPLCYFSFAPLGQWYGKRLFFEPSF